MDELKKTKRRSRFQIRLVTLFWITFAVACFFAGRNWDAITNSVPSVVPKTGTKIRISTATSTVLTSKAPVPRVLISDPSVCRVVPISPNQIQVTALAKGVSSVDLWDENGTITTYRIAVPR